MTKAQEAAELESQLTPLGVYEAVVYGTKSPEGKKFVEAYVKLRELAGAKAERQENGSIDIQDEGQRGFRRENVK